MSSRTMPFVKFKDIVIEEGGYDVFFSDQGEMKKPNL